MRHGNSEGYLVTVDLVRAPFEYPVGVVVGCQCVICKLWSRDSQKALADYLDETLCW